MTDTGIPKPVSGPESRLPQTRQDQPVRVENATGDLANVPRLVRVEGTVTQHNDDGTVRISTPQGDLDVRLRGPDTPADGQRVEVDVAAGQPPRQAVVRIAPEQSPPPSPPSSRAAQNNAAAGAPDAGETGNAPPPPLLSNATASDLAQQAPPETGNAPPPATVQPGDLVRLIPLTAEQTPVTAADMPVAIVVPAQSGDPVRLAQLAAAHATVTPSGTIVSAVPAPPADHLPHTTAAQTAVPAASGKIVSPASAPPPSPASTMFRTTAAAETENLRFTITLPTQGDVATTRPRTPGESAHTLFHSAPRLNSLPITLEATAAPLGKSITLLTVLDIRITSITTPAVKIVSPGAAAQKIAPAVNPFFAPPTPATALEKARAAHAGLPVPAITAAPQAGTAASLTATVTGRTAENFPVLAVILPGQTLPAHFVLRINAANLPEGTVVSFIPHAEAAPLPGAAAMPAPSSSSDLLPAFQWAAFSNLKAVVTQIDPRIVQSFTQTLPNAAAPEQIPAAALFFIAAVRSGDIASWLGDKTFDAIKRAGRADAIDRLSRDMNEAGKLDSAPGTQDDWRALPLPMVAGGDIQRMMLYYRHDRGGQEGGDRDRPRVTRFIFDMSLTRMGAVQLDGLHRPAAKDSKLDLIVRTHAPLSQTMQQSMHRAYVRALEQAGHSGEMSFQNRAEQFVKVDTVAKGHL